MNRDFRAILMSSLPATNAKRLREGANGSRERAPDDKLRDEAIHCPYAAPWIASLTLAMTVGLTDVSPQPPAGLLGKALIKLRRIGLLRRLPHPLVEPDGVIADQDAPALGLDAVEDDFCRLRR
jgi:hypothetical protein